MFDKATFIKPETKVYIEERRPRRNEMTETTISKDQILKAVRGALAAIGKNNSEKEAKIFMEKWT